MTLSRRRGIDDDPAAGRLGELPGSQQPLRIVFRQAGELAFTFGEFAHICRIMDGRTWNRFDDVRSPS